MKFNELEKVYKKYIYLKKDPEYLSVVLSTVIANRFDTEPVWLMIVAPPSSGKSRILGPLQDSPECVMRSLITPNALISSAKKCDTKDGEDASLLPQLDGKVLIIRDATAFEGMHPGNKTQLFSQLRCAFDGSLEKSSGLGTSIFKSKFGIIIGTTPVTERKKSLESNLGERFLYYRPFGLDETDPELWEKVAKQSGNETKVRNDLNKATINFLKEFKEPDRVESPKKIIPLADAITRLRMSYSRDRGTRKIDFPTEKETSIRVFKQMCALYTAMKAVTGSEARAFYTLKQIVLYSAGYYRKRIMDALRRYNLVSEVANSVGTSRSHVQMMIEEMVFSGVVDVEENGNANKYQLKKDIKKLYVAMPRVRS